jgi:NADH-quinone oxidoreductase subunit N
MLQDILSLLPLLSVGIGGVILMLLSPLKSINTKKAIWTTAFFIFVAIASNLINMSGLYSMYPFEKVFHQFLITDTYSGYFNLILLSSGILTLLIGAHYFQKHKEFTTEFFSLFLFSLFGMLLLVQVNELISAFIALEIASLAVYVMVGYQKDREKRVEASYRYLVLGSLAGVFFLLGTALIYGGTGTTSLSLIGRYISLHMQDDMSLILVGGAMIFITFFFKIAAFPFQNWVIDVYDGASYPVTTYMAVTFKTAIFGFILRLVLIDFDSLRDFWDNVFFYVIIFTLVYGSFLAIIQKSLKRMIAASSMVHTGYMLTAFLSIGVIGKGAASAIIFYLVAYFLAATGAFGLLSYISSDDEVRVTYEDFRGFASVRPYMAAMMSVFMLSFAGIPSTIGFIGKFYIFTGAIEAGYPTLAIFGILATFVSIYYYFKVIALMYFYPSAKMQNIPPLKGIAPYLIGLIALTIIWGGVGNMFIAYFPGVDYLIDMAKLSYESLFLN